ncbi:HYR domain-containing protein [Algibacter sp. Ld11]|uniref:HYR domain-containing protein n=1 Tax=Algibacter sp. Ld11 TaxID=649150 RepID=UPI003864F913
MMLNTIKEKGFFTMLLLLIIACSSSGEDEKEEEQQPDIIHPTITCTESITVFIDAGKNGASVAYSTPIGTDDLPGAVTTQTSGLASESLFPIGTTTNTFIVEDKAGNTATCSFDVIVLEPSNDKPYAVKEGAEAPVGKKWVKVDTMSDEFEGNTFDDTKWHRYPSSDGFSWIGRPPALFEADNVTVANGNLNITVEKFDAPKRVNGIDWTHGGAIVRSKITAKPGYYYECRMQANKTIMSSTFWIAFKQNCNTGPVRKLELDIQECVGRLTNTAAWADNFDQIYASNTWRHERECDTEVTGSKQSPAKTVLSEKNNSRYFVYGCWWKSPTEILFYLDGKLSHSITNPPADFDLEGHITMAIETYDWNPIDANTIFGTGSFDDLTTKYDWVRTWKLENE